MPEITINKLYKSMDVTITIEGCSRSFNPNLLDPNRFPPSGLKAIQERREAIEEGLKENPNASIADILLRKN